jgi:hypothetical protein
LIFGLIGSVDGARLAHRGALVSSPLAISVLASSLLPVLLAKELPKVLPKVLVDGMLAGLW